MRSITGMTCKPGLRVATAKDLRRLFLEPTPGFSLRRPGRLADNDFEAGKLRLDLGARQHVQAAHQHRALNHRRLRAIEALEGAVRGAMCDAAHETRPELIFAHLDDDE